MNKLFDDTLYVQKERPVRITNQQKDELYVKLANEVIEGNYSNSYIKVIIDDLRSLNINDSEYEKAKNLENYGTGSYDISIEFIEWLDCMRFYKDEILRDNIKLWVKANNPQPKFKTGTKLIIENSLNIQKTKGSIVYVTGIRNDEANYLIDSDINRSGGTVIAYEKVESNCKELV